MVKKIFSAPKALTSAVKTALLFLLFIMITSCARKKKEIIHLHFDKDLIPEGIAIDSITQTIFLSSLKLDKIVQCHGDGTNPRDFITSNQYNYLSGFGMTIRGDTLFALGNSLPKTNSRSILLLLNVNNGALIHSYSSPDTTFKYLNDLAVCANGDIYITDSESNRIYTIDHMRGVLEVYLESDEVANSNGIAVSADQKYLYLASYRQGIRIVDRFTKQIINASNLDYTGIDGMKYYRNSLIAIVNSKKESSENGVYRFFLNTDHTSILRKEKLISFQEDFKTPTTFDIRDGYLYFIMNSQLKNFDDKSHQIIDSSSLEAYRMMKLKIE